MNAIGGVQKTRFKKFYSKGIGYEKVSRKLVLKKIETKRGTIKQSKGLECDSKRQTNSFLKKFKRTMIRKGRDTRRNQIQRQENSF